MQWVAEVVFRCLVFRLDLFFMQCSGPTAPRILKQRGVQIQFILDVVLWTFCPCFLKQWHAGVYRLHLFYKQCERTFGPSHFKTEIQFILDVVLSTFCPHFQKQWHAGVFRLHLLYMQCSRPSAPCIEKLSHVSITKF